MAWIHIENEQARLERAWEEALAPLPDALRAAERSLLARIDLGRGRAASWPRLFAPWTSLYPLLQAEALGGADLHQATRLNLAHLALLVHAFADDRARDGQVRLDEKESAFSAFCLELGMDRLNDELPEVFPAHAEVEALLAAYRQAQEASWPERRPSDGGDSRDREVRRIAGGRAIHGFLAPLALGLGAGASDEQLDRMRRAYDLLVTGLQWGDDIEDWAEDWRNGRQNLLLAALPGGEFDAGDSAGNGAGGEPVAEPVTEDDLRLVGRELVRRGIVGQALDEADRCFEQAADLQAAMGAPTLSRLLRMLKIKVGRLRERIEASGPV